MRNFGRREVEKWGLIHMAKHVFGGDWTNDKLERVRNYLSAYTQIFKSNPRAAYFTTTYVDAFAGTGHRTESETSLAKNDSGTELFPLEDDEVLDDSDAAALQKGSARIALDNEPPFDRFLFIEQNSRRIADLKELKTEFPSRRDVIHIERGDANEVLQQWCRQTDWHSNRAVVFLDPYGMQVEWKTMECVADTQAIDIWILFPLGMAINRLLTRNEPPPQKWADALTRFFGCDEWRTEFYRRETVKLLWGDEEVEKKDATLERIGQYFLKRLGTKFEKVAPNPRILRNSTGLPIYLLCFAAGNPKGAPTAVRIAKHILAME